MNVLCQENANLGKRDNRTSLRATERMAVSCMVSAVSSYNTALHNQYGSWVQCRDTPRSASLRPPYLLPV